VTSPKVAPDTLLATDIATNAVGTAEIATNAVTATEIAAGAVASSEILDGSLTALDVTKASESLFVDFPALAAGRDVRNPSRSPDGRRDQRLQRHGGADRPAGDELPLRRPRRLIRYRRGAPTTAAVRT
jgi:hypothetical protein